MRNLLAPVLAGAAVLLSAQATPRAYLGATLVNPGMDPVKDAVVVVKDGRILAAGPARWVTLPANVERVQVTGKWIIPGLIDSHVHFFQSGGLYTRPDGRDLRAYRSYEEEQRLIRRDLPETFARILRCGITSVIDMGGPTWNFEMRDQAARAEKAPRVWTAGPLLTPGPLKDRRTGGPHFLTTGADPAVIAGTTEEAARAEVRRQAGLHADVFKMWVSEGPTTAVQFAAYDEARKLGLKVAVHATTLAGATEAVRAGADILVHSIVDQAIPDALMAEMKRRGVTLIPTLVVFRGGPMLTGRRWAFDPWEYEGADPKVMGTLFDLMRLPLKLEEAEVRAIQEAKPWTPSPVALSNLRRLVAAGVSVAAGTDAGNPGTFHGASFTTELKLMAMAGLTPRQILACATLNGARLLGHDQELGSVEPGKRADLLVLDADPLKDILNTRKLLLVVKDGRPYRPSEILQDTPEDVVQRQVNAYNARDVEAFAATYAPGVTIRTLPETTVTVSGRKALADRYGEAFRQRADVGVAITSRAVDGPFVIDQETFVHRWDASRTRFAGTAIYEVKDGLIRTVWFLKAPNPETPPAP
jgi:imidazolonepropionase-like amidohydrolase